MESQEFVVLREDIQGVREEILRLRDTQTKAFEKLDESFQRQAKLEQWQANHEKNHDTGFNKTVAVAMAVAAFLAVGVSIVIAVVK